jgi:hypothetical protein
MSLRVSLLRCGRLVQQTQRIPFNRPVLIRSTVPLRSFHAYPPIRNFSTEQSAPNSTSAETSASADAQPTPNESAETVKNPAEETSTASEDNPPPPPKRDVDPKDHELAELKVDLTRNSIDNSG